MIAEAAPYVRPTQAHPRFKRLDAVGEIERFAPDALSSMGLDTARFCNELFGTKEVTFIDRVRIGNGAVVKYRETWAGSSAPSTNEASLANLTRGDFKGYISPGTARKCKKMITAWMNSVSCAASSRMREQVTGQIYSTFATITLPSNQIHSDNEIKRSILMPFLQSLKRDFGIIHYFWKAEPQENGRIHFHILLDKYIDRELFSHWWDRACEHLGYVSRYAEQSGSLFPPACNITQLPTDSKAIGYVVKYLAKAPIRLRSITPSADGTREVRCHYFQPKVKNGIEMLAEYRPIMGRVWGCSDGVRECRPPAIGESDRVAAFIEYLKEQPRTRVRQIDRAEVICGNVLENLRRFDKWLWTLWRWHHLATFNYLYGDRGHPPSGVYDELGVGLTECYR